MLRRAAVPLATCFTLLLACGPISPREVPDAGEPATPDAGEEPLRNPGGTDAGSAGATTIRVHYFAGARPVWLRGSDAPLSWFSNVATRRSGNGEVYEYRFVASAPRVEFKPMLEDHWSIGPNYSVRRGEAVDVYPRFFTQTGKVVRLFAKLHSELLGNDRDIWAYLPASYEENSTARFPVLYMHDGQNLFDGARASFGNEWKVDEALDEGGLDGSIRELVVIGVDGPGTSEGRIHEYTPTQSAAYPGSGGATVYLRFLADELKPKVDAALRTLPGRATTGVMGSSLGGLVSCHAGNIRPEVFGIVGAMSPSTWWDGRWMVGQVRSLKDRPVRPDRVYVDVGTDHDGQEDTVFLFDAYRSAGYVEGKDLRTVTEPGGVHNEPSWARRLPAALTFLFGRRDP